MRNLVIALGLLGLGAPAMAQQAQPQPVAAAFDRKAALDAVAALADALEKRFVFPETARAYAAMLRAKLAAGAYAGIADAETLANTVTADLQAVAADGHLRMRAPGGGAPVRGSGGAGTQPRRPDPIEQPGWIAPGVAYIRFNAFLGGDEAKQFAAFLDTHLGARTLIIDARTHHGGGLDEMDQLFPRIFAKPQTVMVMDTRGDVGVFEISDTVVAVEAPGDVRRSEHRVAPGADSPWRGAKIYYLTSGRTASAGEHLATVFKYTGRATLIGETTAGAGNYGGSVELPGGYSAFIPVGHSYFPGTRGWEGTGVAPDIAVAPERALVEALVRAGVAPAEAETLSASHVPGEPMVRRRPLRP
ncbi:MAG: S41 family peptidase [Sphingomonas sp.]|uniref:S41 family peptidase n=1 Tax=Sphingomonas sp. TaxID=28214 RepID=UPI0025EE7CAF|nr:S41 family peptidase [Sphingomonas sp.]MBX3563332.1 S41 family peptidase [Sphingomonas sp.]